jgi:hypothetical protein
MEAKLAVVREAKKRLDDRHFKWILDAAMAHFAERVEETETTITRYTQLPELPIFSRYGKDLGPDYAGAKREAEIPKLRASLEEYYAILDFLHAMSDAEVVRSAEVFAAAFRDSGGFFGGERGGRSGSRRDR